MGNDVDLWEMSQICGKMALVLYKRHINVENDLGIWKKPKCLGSGLDAWFPA